MRAEARSWDLRNGLGARWGLHLHHEEGATGARVGARRDRKGGQNPRPRAEGIGQACVCV